MSGIMDPQGKDGRLLLWHFEVKALLFFRLQFGRSLGGLARARFCHYFTPPIRIPLIPEEGKFPKKNRVFPKNSSLKSIVLKFRI